MGHGEFEPGPGRRTPPAWVAWFFCTHKDHEGHECGALFGAVWASPDNWTELRLDQGGAIRCNVEVTCPTCGTERKFVRRFLNDRPLRKRAPIAPVAVPGI